MNIYVKRLIWRAILRLCAWNFYYVKSHDFYHIIERKLILRGHWMNGDSIFIYYSFCCLQWLCTYSQRKSLKIRRNKIFTKTSSMQTDTILSIILDFIISSEMQMSTAEQLF